MTPEEYVALEDGTPYRSEFYDGAMIAMKDRTYANAIINGNLIGLLHPTLRDTPWEFFSSNMRVLIPSLPLYTYPDGSIVRRPAQTAPHSDTTLINPCLIVEVLPPPGENYGRRATFQHFQRVDSLRDYVLISQEFPHIDHYAKLEENKWLYTTHEGLDTRLRLPSLDLELPMSEIYERVKFPKSGVTRSKKHPLHGKII